MTLFVSQMFDFVIYFDRLKSKQCCCSRNTRALYWKVLHAHMVFGIKRVLLITYMYVPVCVDIFVLTSEWLSCLQ